MSVEKIIVDEMRKLAEETGKTVVYEFGSVTRVEVIDHAESLNTRVQYRGGPRAIYQSDDISVGMSLQDDSRTLKVFISRKRDSREAK